MGNFLDLHALLSAFLLSASVSADALAVGFSYGASRIHVPLRSLLMIAAICTAVTGGFVCLGTIALPIIPPAMASILSVCLRRCMYPPLRQYRQATDSPSSGAVPAASVPRV